MTQIQNLPNFYRVSTKALVRDAQDRILLSKEVTATGQHWELLGGGLDHGEVPLDGLAREIREEAGLVIKNAAPAPCFFSTSLKLDSTWGAFVVYEITLENLDFTPSDECQELKWFTPEEILVHPDIFENVKKLAQALTTGQIKFSLDAFSDLLDQ